MTSRTGIVILCGALSMGALAEAEQRAPARVSTGLPADVMALACAPGVAYEAPTVTLRVTGGQDSSFRRIYMPGDLVTISAGTRNGLEVGQEFFVRRVQSAIRDSINRKTPATIRTAGWVRVYAVDETLSLATITHACDTIQVGDYLEPFVLPQVTPPSADRPKPQRDNYGRVLSGQDRRRSFGKDDFLAVDRGSDHGIERGTMFMIYRDKKADENFLFEIGEAVAVDVRPESATLKVTMSRDAIQAGDYVAMRR